MTDTSTEITRQSWFSRITGSICAMLFGFILAPLAIVLLFWNEGREINTAKSLEEGAAAVVSVQADVINAANNLKLIHISGEATTGDVLHDPTFGVSVNAIRLSRKIQIYEWNEVKSQNTEKVLGGGTETVTTYSYEKKWCPELIDSSHFKEASNHINPPQMLANSLNLAARDISLGAFKLSESVVSHMSATESLPLTSDNLEQLPPGLKVTAQIDTDGFYFGGDPHVPEVGDQKVDFAVLRPGPFSIVARQIGDTLEPYPTHTGREIMLVEPGEISADLMFHHAESENQILAWILRGVGAVLLFIGLAMIFRPITAFADVIPLFGDILGMGTTLAAAFLTITISLLTISIAWITYRPFIGGLLLAAAIAWLIWSKSLGLNRARGKLNSAAN